MMVILRENIDHLGRIGDVVKVSDGYARNFLLPRKLCEVADHGNLARVDHQKKILEKKRLAEKSGAEELAKKVSDHSCTITRKVAEKDKLFGSVTTNDIADQLAKAGFTISKSQIQLDAPIKALGVHSVTVKLQPDVTATLKVWVVKQE